MKFNIFVPLIAAAGMTVAYTQLSTQQCGVVLDSERRSVLGSITSDIESKLGAQRGIRGTDMCQMPVNKLKRAIYRVEKPKPDHPGEAAAFRYQSLLNEHGELDVNLVNKAKQQVDAMKRVVRYDAGITKESWEELGPGNIGGRIRSFVFDPTDANRMLAGSVSGGLWETTNSGARWEPVDDFMANLSITSLAYDPTDNDVIYAGTGEGFFNADAIRGLGVFKSTDNGKTWQSLEKTHSGDFKYVNRLGITSDGSEIYAATNGGLWRSVDDGENWDEIFEGLEYVLDEATEETAFSFFRIQDFDISPVNNDLLIASTNGAPLYSEDGGNTWSVASPFPLIEESEEDGSTVKSVIQVRIETAFSKSNPMVVYASVDNNGGELYKSTDGGKSYTLVNSGTSYLGMQGWYDNALWVDPVDPDHVIVGGIDLWRSQDGGQSFTQISTWWASPWSAHADHHIIVEHPNYDGVTNKEVYFGNDGGMYKSADLDKIVEDRVEYIFEGWQELNNNLGITQFYGMDVAPDGTIIGGTQDNGTLVLKPGKSSEEWHETFGGDGGYSVADPTDSNYLYGEYVYLNIHRSTNGGLSWPEPGYSRYIHDPAMEEGAQFIAPFILDKNNPHRMLAGANKLWVSDNVKDETPIWSILKPVTESGASISSIAVANGNSDLVFVGYANGEIYKTVNATEKEPVWTRIDTEDMPARSNFRLAIDPLNNDNIYASYSGYANDNFWRSEDGGATWTVAVGSGLVSLPPAPVRGIAIHPTKTNRIYLGTELGVFTTEDKGNTWSLSNDGPANVAIDELVWQNENTLLAATHGRGIFRATIEDRATPNAIAFASKEGVAVNTEIMSDVATISGITVKADISVTNGEYALDCDKNSPTFTAEAGKVSNGARICVRHTSSEDTNTETTTTLNLAGSNVDFVTKTLVDRTPDAITIAPVVDAELNTVLTSPTVTVTSIDVPLDISIEKGEYSIGCEAGSFTAEAGTIEENQSFCIRHTTSSNHGTTVRTRLTLGNESVSFNSTTKSKSSSGGSSGLWLLALGLLGLRRRF
jgi:photosystem II stability/assembly factor-like uncharacterized protein